MIVETSPVEPIPPAVVTITMSGEEALLLRKLCGGLGGGGKSKTKLFVCDSVPPEIRTVTSNLYSALCVDGLRYLNPYSNNLL